MPIQDFIADLMNPDLAFLRRALAVTLLSSVLAGVVGCHVVLRGMAFVGDAVAHAVFPGLAVAFVVQGSLFMGGLVAGVVTSILVAVFSQNRRIGEDSVIGVFLVGSFAAGLVIVSRSTGYAGSLQDFLFGSLAGVPQRDVAVAALVTLGVLALLSVLHRPLVTLSLDREMARAMGMKPLLLDLLLYVCVTLAVVVGLQTVGNILVLALLITPPATARLFTDRVLAMMIVSPLVGAVGAVVGIYLSWSYDLPAGATIVLALTLMFVLGWMLAPRHGMLTRRVRRRRSSRPAG